jgi:hypothetical protein
MATVDTRRVFRDRRLGLGALAAGVAGLALWALGASAAPAQAFYSYLAAYAYVASLVLGVLAFSLISRAMGATWVLAVRRLEEAVIAALPALAVLFVPVALGMAHLYPWANPDAAHSEHLRHLLEHRQRYLDQPFFVGRAVFYLAAWLVMGELLRRWSLAIERRRTAPADRQKRPGATAEALDARGQALSAAMLPLLGLTVTFAAFDWLMSIEPEWFSSAFGVYYAAGSFLGGLSLLTILAHRARRGALAEELTRYHFHALGRLLLAFVVFWAYIAFFQAMLIRIADRPEEVTFYLHRLTGSWAWLTYALILGHFVLPFFLLLPRPIKYRSGALAGLSIWLLVMHYLDVYWLVLPVLHRHGAAPHWLDLASLAGVAGIAVAVAAWRQYGLSLLAEAHPRLDRALRYRSQSA